jgi:hypothetical protein
MATNEPLTKLLAGRKVDSVRQRGAELDIDFEDGSTLSLKLSGPTQSVTLTNEKDKQEYAA